MALPLAAIFTGGFFAKTLAFVLAGVVVRVAAAIGIGFVAFQGIDIVTTQIENFVNNSVGLLDSYVVDMLTLSGFMFTIEIILATFVGIMSIKALTATKRMIFK